MNEREQQKKLNRFHAEQLDRITDELNRNKWGDTIEPYDVEMEKELLSKKA